MTFFGANPSISPPRNLAAAAPPPCKKQASDGLSHSQHRLRSCLSPLRPERASNAAIKTSTALFAVLSNLFAKSASDRSFPNPEIAIIMEILQDFMLQIRGT